MSINFKMHRLLRKTIRAIALALLYAFMGGMIGAFLGFFGGLAIGIFYESVLKSGGAQGPLLMILTGPLGVAIGIGVGLWQGFTMPDPNSAFNVDAAKSQNNGA